MNETEFQQMLAMAKKAGHEGKPMPDFGPVPQISKVQMAVLNKTFEEAYNASASSRRAAPKKKP